MIGSTLYITSSIVLAISCVMSIYMQEEQFYPTVIQISKSKGTLLVLFNVCVVCLWIKCKLLVRVFFGELKQAEIQNVQSHGVNYVIDLLFALYFMNIKFTGYVACHFVANAMVESIHTLASKRVEYVSPRQIFTEIYPKLSYFKMFALHLLLGILDLLCINYYFTYEANIFRTYILFEYIILFLGVLKSFADFLFCSMERLCFAGNWDSKYAIMGFFDLVFTMLKVLTVLFQYFYLSKITNMGFLAAFKVSRELSSAYKTLKQFMEARKLLKKLKTFPDATAEEIHQEDDKCIFCLDNLVSAKKINCGHLFHFNCLRSYLINSNNPVCPKCRASISDNISQRNHNHVNQDQRNHVIRCPLLSEPPQQNRPLQIGPVAWGLPQEVRAHKIDREAEKARTIIENTNQFLIKFYQNPPDDVD